MIQENLIKYNVFAYLTPLRKIPLRKKFFVLSFFPFLTPLKILKTFLVEFNKITDQSS